MLERASPVPAVSVLRAPGRMPSLGKETLLAPLVPWGGGRSWSFRTSQDLLLLPREEFCKNLSPYPTT